MASRPSVLLRLADPRNRSTAQAALAGKYTLVTEEDPSTAETPRVATGRWTAAGYRAAILDYRAEDAASVKLVQACTDEPAAPRLLFALPAGAAPELPQLLMAMNEGAAALLPTPFEGAALANYVERALTGPGRFRAERAERTDGGERKRLEGEVREWRARAAAGQRLTAHLLSTPSGDWVRQALVVSDSPFQRELLERLLREHGFHVVSVATAREGLRLALAEKPRVVISDLELAEMDGVAFCRALKLEHKFAPCHFVVCTANRDKMAAVMSPGNGVDDCLPKPSAPADTPEFITRVAMGLLL